MTGRPKKALPAELRELALRVSMHREELLREMRELAEVGTNLRAEHLRRMREPEEINLGADPPRAVNPMCGRCLNACKQDASARIFHCARFEAV